MSGRVLSSYLGDEALPDALHETRASLGSLNDEIRPLRAGGDGRREQWSNSLTFWRPPGSGARELHSDKSQDRDLDSARAE